MWRSVSTIYDDYFKISPIILAVLGIITIIIETFYPLFVLLKSTRKYIVIIMIMMHFGIAVFMDLPMFAAIMIVWDVTSYYDYFSTPNLFNKK